MVSDRTGAIVWATRMVGDPGVLYLDTETTGLGDDAEIVDISAIDNHGVVRLNTLVQPTAPIPPETTAIHGITDAKVESAPRWADVHGPLLKLFNDYPTVVIYNAAFDSRILRQVSQRHGLPIPAANWECAMLSYASFAGVWHERFQAWRWHRLGAAAHHLGLAAPDVHRAMTDAAVCRAVVHAMAASSPVA